MALKRSGVRASSAPYNPLSFPRCLRVIRSSVRFSVCSSLIRFLRLVCTIGVLTVGAAGVDAQLPSQKASSGTRTDVILFVLPNGPTSARIGLAYRKRIPHAQVRREIKRLIAAAGWKLSRDLSITDKTVRPDVPSRFPPTTSATFGVADAPQFQDNAPVLLPYLQAFQAWNRIEVLFKAPDLEPYNGVTNFHTPSLDVTLVKTEGVYGYLATVREHSKSLPPLLRNVPDAPREHADNAVVSPAAAPNAPDVVGEAGANNPALFRPALLLFAGSLLTGGVALYLLAKRRQHDLKPGRLP